MREGRENGFGALQRDGVNPLNHRKTPPLIPDSRISRTRLAVSDVRCYRNAAFPSRRTLECTPAYTPSQTRFTSSLASGSVTQRTGFVALWGEVITRLQLLARRGLATGPSSQIRRCRTSGLQGAKPTSREAVRQGAPRSCPGCCMILPPASITRRSNWFRGELANVLAHGRRPV